MYHLHHGSQTFVKLRAISSILINTKDNYCSFIHTSEIKKYAQFTFNDVIINVVMKVNSGGFLHNRLATLLRTGEGRFGSCSYKRSMASTVACECGAEEQTVDHVVLLCLIPRPPQRLHALRF